MSTLSGHAVASRSPWRRRNTAERTVRDAIGAEPGLAIFGSGFDPAIEHGEVFVTLTAVDERARRAAVKLLNGSSGLAEEDWVHGWRRLQLGDWMIRIYPERTTG